MYCSLVYYAVLSIMNDDLRNVPFLCSLAVSSRFEEIPSSWSFRDPGFTVFGSEVIIPVEITR